MRKDFKTPTKSRSPCADDDDANVGPSDGNFLPRLERPCYEHPDDPTQELPFALNYGCHAYLGDVVLGFEEISRLVDVPRDELGTRGLTTSVILSLALDASPSAVKRLIQTFLEMCARPSAEADRQW